MFADVESLATVAVAVSTVCSLCMTGLIWFVQVVHYPLIGRVPFEARCEYCREHASRTGWVVGPIMITELCTGVVAQVLTDGPPLLLTLANGLLLVIFASTFLVQVPLHRQLHMRGDARLVHRLAASNWVRTVAWTLRSLVLMKVVLG